MIIFREKPSLVIPSCYRKYVFSERNLVTIIIIIILVNQFSLKMLIIVHRI